MNKSILAGSLLFAILATAVLITTGAAPVTAISCGLIIGVLAVRQTVARWFEARVPRDTVLTAEGTPRGLVARWVEAYVNPLPRVWSTLVRLSFKGQTKDPAAMRERPAFKVETWPIVGPMPIASRTPVKNALFNVGHTALKSALAMPRNESRGREPDDVHKLAERYFGKSLMQIMPPKHQHDLSPERLYEQVTVSGFYHVRPNNDGTHSLDLQFLRDYPVRSGASLCGGEAVVDLKGGRLLRLVTPEEIAITPDDPRFEVEALRFRSSLFQWVTIVPHSSWCHGMVAPKLFLAAYALPETHPLREFLRPFVFKVHENAGRSNVTVFGRTGVLWNVGAMTPTATQALSVRSVNSIEIRKPAQLHMPPYLRSILEPLWDAMDALVKGFLVEFSIDDDDPHMRAFRSFAAVNIHNDFHHLPLSCIIVYCMFTSTVAHHLWGHIFPGTTDPRYVSVYARNSRATDKGALMTMAEPIEWTIVRVGVVLSTRREVVRLSEQLDVSVDDPRIKSLFREFSEKIRAVVQEAPPLLELTRVATSGML